MTKKTILIFAGTVVAVVAIGLLVFGLGLDWANWRSTDVAEGPEGTGQAGQTTLTVADSDTATTDTTVMNVNLDSFEENGLYGFKDPDGRVVIPPQFEQVGHFSEALCPAWLGDKAGYIDSTGAWVLQPQYEDARGFGEGLATVKAGGLWGLIDHSGAMVVPARYEELWFFSEGLMKAVLGSKTGWIDRNGEWVIQPQFDNGWHFRNGLAAAESGGMWGYIDKSGEFVIQPQYDYASEFWEAGELGWIAEVELNGETIKIDTAGKPIE